LCRSASVCHAVTLRVCIRRISLGGEGNALYPVLSSFSLEFFFIGDCHRTSGGSCDERQDKIDLQQSA